MWTPTVYIHILIHTRRSLEVLHRSLRSVSCLPWAPSAGSRMHRATRRGDESRGGSALGRSWCPTHRGEAVTGGLRPNLCRREQQFQSTGTDRVGIDRQRGKGRFKIKAEAVSSGRILRAPHAPIRQEIPSRRCRSPTTHLRFLCTATVINPFLFGAPTRQSLTLP